MENFIFSAVQYLCGNFEHSVSENVLWYIMFSFSKRSVFIFIIIKLKMKLLAFPT